MITHKRLKSSRDRLSKFSQLVYSLISSNGFLRIVLIIFIVQAFWIALSSSYPMIYDERYHVGAINVFAHTISPFIGTQDQSTAVLGDLTRYGSYLYHYLMSFPLRIFEVFTSDASIQIFLLRIVNIIISVSAVHVLYKTLLELRFSRFTSNVSILIASMFPAIIALAATVNYDSLFFLLAAAHIYVFVKLSNSNFGSIKHLLLVLITGCLGCVTKFSFLPIFFATILILVVTYTRRFKRKKSIITYGRVKNSLNWKIALLACLAVISTGLFIERYIYNLVIYKSPNPDCSVVQSVAFCAKWPPWARNDMLDKKYPDQEVSVGSAINYETTYWLKDNVERLTLIGKSNANGVSSNALASESILMVINFIATISVVILFLALFYLRRDRTMSLVALVMATYAAALFMTNLSDFLSLGKPIAIHGRYLFWMFPTLLALVLVCSKKMIEGLYGNSRWFRATGIALILLLLSQFGGLVTYWTNYDASWSANWITPEAVIQVNELAGNVADKLVVGR